MSGGVAVFTVVTIVTAAQHISQSSYESELEDEPEDSDRMKRIEEIVCRLLPEGVLVPMTDTSPDGPLLSEPTACGRIGSVKGYVRQEHNGRTLCNCISDPRG